MNSKGFLVAAFALLLAPFACSFAAQGSSKARSNDQTLRSSSKTYEQDVNSPTLQKRGWRYQVQPGDSFTINFPFTPEFNQEVAVQPDGYVTLRGLGEVPIAGKSLPELRDLVRTAYSGIVSQQVITVELKDFEKPYFIVGGQVGHPGKYDLRGDTTVAQAVEIAGGFQETAKHSQVLLFRRISDQWMEARKLDLKKMLREGNLSEDLHLRPDDLVYVPKNALSKIKPFIPVTAFNPRIY